MFAASIYLLRVYSRGILQNAERLPNAEWLWSEVIIGLGNKIE